MGKTCHKDSYEGTPWIILNHRKDDVETWYTRLDAGVRSPSVIGIQINLEESEDAYIDIIDWEGKSGAIWQNIHNKSNGSNPKKINFLGYGLYSNH